jgi:hypothetical protein
VAALFRAGDELASLSFNPDLAPHAWRRESPESAMRTAARRLGLSHTRGRVWGELESFVSAGLVDGWGTCVVAVRFRRPLDLGLRIRCADSSATDKIEQLRSVRLDRSIADSLRAHAREPDIARHMLAHRDAVRSLQTLRREGSLTVDDDRIELTIAARDISSRAVVIALRETSSLAHELRRRRTEFPRSDHENLVQKAWVRQASARGGHFDAEREALTFDALAGEIRVNVERDDDAHHQGWRTNIVLTFARPLVKVPASAHWELKDLESLTDAVELDAKQVRAHVARPLHDEAELSKVLEALVSAGAAIAQEAEAGRSPYR